MTGTASIWDPDRPDDPESVLRQDLASQSVVTKGAGQVGYNGSLGYAAGTVGAAIYALVVGGGVTLGGLTNAGAAPYNASPANTPAQNVTAINNALAAGTWVYLPPGNYAIDTALTIPNNTHLFGGGIESTKIYQVTNGATILDCSGDYAGVSGISLSYVLTAVTAGGFGVGAIYQIASVGTTDFTLVGASSNTVGVVFTATGAGVGTGTATPSPIAGSRAMDISGYLFTFDRMFIANCYDGLYVSAVAARGSNTDCYAYVNTALFCINNTNDFTLDKFIFNALDKSWGRFGGVRLADNVQAIQLSDGDIIKGRYSLTMDASTYGIGTVPQTCTFTNIYFDSADLGAIVDKCIAIDFTNCGFAYSGENIGATPGVVIGSNNCDTVRFTSCRFWINGSNGAQLSIGAKRTTFSNCNFESNGISNINGCGLLVDAGVTDFTVENCILRNGIAGVATSIAALGVGIDYTVSFVGTSDFTLVGAASNTIGTKFVSTGNSVGTGIALTQPAGMQSYGLYIAPGVSDRYVVTGNIVTGNRTAGILDGGSGLQKFINSNVGYNAVGTEETNVLDFFADGTGAVQTLVDNTGVVDSTLGIQAALNASKSVRIPRGTYKISGQLVPQTGGNVYGDGNKATQINMTVNNLGAFNCTNTDATITDLAISYTVVPVAGGTSIKVAAQGFTGQRLSLGTCYGGIEITSTSKAKISDIEITNYLQTGILINTSSNVELTRFYMNPGNTTDGILGGIRIAEQCENISISQGKIDAGLYPITVGATVYGIGTVPKSVTVNDVSFAGYATTAFIDNCVDVKFSNCTFTSITSSGVDGLTVGPTNSDSVRFTNCTFIGCGGNGAVIAAAATRTAFSDCLFESNGIAGASSGLAAAVGASNWTVINCTFNVGLVAGSVQNYGVTILATNTNFRIANSIFTNNITAPYLMSTTSAGGIVVNNIGAANWGRVDGTKGAVIASANDLTFGNDANLFPVSGAIQINRFNNTNWRDGDRITIKTSGAPTIKNNLASASPAIKIKNAGSADLVMTAGSSVTYQYDSTGDAGAPLFSEVSRAIF